MAQIIWFTEPSKNVEQSSVYSKVKDRPNYSLVLNNSMYFVGPAIYEVTEFFGEQTNPVDMSRLVDRLQCRIAGYAERKYSDQAGQEGFYFCTKEKNKLLTAPYSEKMKAQVKAKNQQYGLWDIGQRAFGVKEKKYPSIG